MKQQFKEDKAELEAHFADRVQSYIELGETPEQARLSAREKFGETEVVMRKLQRRVVLRSPIAWAMVCAVSYVLVTALTKAFFAHSVWTNPIYFFTYSLCTCVYIWLAPKAKRC